MVTGHCIGQLLGRTLPALHAPHTAYVAAVAPLTLHLWHERLSHRSMDAVEFRGSLSTPRRVLSTIVLPVQLASSIATPVLPRPLMPHVHLNL